MAVGPQPQLAQEVKGAKEARLQSYAHVQGHLLEAQVGAQALSVAVVGPQSQAAQPHLRKTGTREAQLHSQLQALSAVGWAQAPAVARPQPQVTQPPLWNTVAKEALLQSYAQQGHLEAQLWAQALSVT